MTRVRAAAAVLRLVGLSPAGSVAQVARMMCRIDGKRPGIITPTQGFATDPATGQVTMGEALLDNRTDGPARGVVPANSPDRPTRSRVRKAMFMRNLSARVDTTPVGVGNRLPSRGARGQMVGS